MLRDRLRPNPASKLIYMRMQSPSVPANWEILSSGSLRNTKNGTASLFWKPAWLYSPIAWSSSLVTQSSSTSYSQPLLQAHRQACRKELLQFQTVPHPRTSVDRPWTVCSNVLPLPLQLHLVNEKIRVQPKYRSLCSDGNTLDLTTIVCRLVVESSIVWVICRLLCAWETTPLGDCYRNTSIRPQSSSFSHYLRSGRHRRWGRVVLCGDERLWRKRDLWQVGSPPNPLLSCLLLTDGHASPSISLP